MAITCTPAGTISGCAKCYSNSDLLAAIAYILCQINGSGAGDCTPSTLMTDAACFACESDSELLNSIFTMLYTYAYDSGYLGSDAASDVINNAACLTCAPPKMVRAIVVKEFCDYLSALR